MAPGSQDQDRFGEFYYRFKGTIWGFIGGAATGSVFALGKDGLPFIEHPSLNHLIVDGWRGLVWFGLPTVVCTVGGYVIDVTAGGSINRQQ